MTDGNIGHGEFTQLLDQAAEGDALAREKLVKAAYAELHRIATRLMRSEGNHTLQPTALVHEAYDRLLRDNALENSPNRAYFYASASRTMRRVLVDAARKRKSQKAGGQFNRQPFDVLLDSYQSHGVDICDLDEALDDLEKLHDRQARVVELRFLYGMTVAEVAKELGLSVPTIESDWRSARAFLFQRLSDDE